MSTITEKYPQTLLEALAIHSFLGSLGYSLKSEMFILFNERDVCVLLKAEGKSIAIRAGRAEHDTEKMVALWKSLLEEWNPGGSMTTEDKVELYDRSMICKHGGITIAVLVTVGLTRFQNKKHDPSLN